jgi:hypothetical protein
MQNPTPDNPSAQKRIAVGIDIGSTTVKAVVCDPETKAILWSDYQRHETRQPEKTLEFMVRIGNAFPNAEDIEIFVTGSGSGPLQKPLGARFVQEVNAVTLAVEKLHPDVGSVIELGGQDAKIIMFREVEKEDGESDKTAMTSMNDKCASGTGATIDKCMIKVGLPQEEVAKIVFDPNKLHHARFGQRARRRSCVWAGNLERPAHEREACVVCPAKQQVAGRNPSGWRPEREYSMICTAGYDTIPRNAGVPARIRASRTPARALNNPDLVRCREPGPCQLYHAACRQRAIDALRERSV